MAGSSPAMTSKKSLHQLHAAHRLEILVIDLLAVGLRHRQAVEDLQRLADVHRAAFRIERAIRSKNDLFEWIEVKPADSSGAGSEHRSVGVKILLEIIERALLEALAQPDIVLVAGARTHNVPAGTETAFKHRDDAAEMVHEDLQVGITVDDLRPHQPRHGGGGLVRPTEAPPDFVFGFLFGERIIRRLGA